MLIKQITAIFIEVVSYSLADNPVRWEQPVAGKCKYRNIRSVTRIDLCTVSTYLEISVSVSIECIGVGRDTVI